MSVYKPCYSRCETCLQSGDQYDNNCITCLLPDYHLIEDDPGRCITEDELINPNYSLDQTINMYIKCKKYFYINTNNKIVCTNQCEGKYPLIIPDLNQCVNNCKNHGYVQYKKTCLIECPDVPVPMSDYLGKCIETSLLQDPIDGFVETDRTIEDLLDIELDYPVSEMASLEKNIKGVGFVLQVYPSDSDELSRNDVSSLNVSNCEKVLIEKYNLPKDEKLIIAKFDIYNKDNTSMKVEYLIFDSKGNKLNLEYCEGLNTEVYYPIRNKDDILSEEAITMKNEGIDIFNPNDPFFNDICFPYSTLGNDVLLKDRRESMYKEVSFCEDGCYYEEIDYISQKAKCKCQTKTEFAQEYQELSEIKDKDSFPNALPFLNIVVVKCYVLFPVWNSIKNNIAFWLMDSITLIMIISIIKFYRFDYFASLSKINNIPNNLLKASPPYVVPVKSECNRNLKLRLEQNFINYFARTDKTKFTCTNQKSSKSSFSSDYFEKNESINSNAIKGEDKIMENYLAQINEKIKEFNNCGNVNQIIVHNNDTYTKSIKYDKRGFCSMYFQYLQQNQRFLRAVFIPYQFESFGLNLSLFLFALSIQLMFNGILFIDSEISKKYYNEYSYYNLILRGVVCDFIGLAFLQIIKIFAKFSKKVIAITEEIKHQTQYLQLALIILKRERKKLIFYFIIQFLVTLFILYYLTLFCIVYHSSQLLWFTGACVGILIGLILSLIINFLLTIFRYCSLKKSKRRLYNSALFIQKYC